MAHEPSTQASLFDRLRQQPADEGAWEQFVRRYGPMIESWCRHWGGQDADAQDVAQAVLTTLVVRLRTFAYDPAQRFRGWLQTVTRHAWAAFVEGRNRATPGSGDSQVNRVLESVEAREDLVRRVQEQFDH